jgi:hypothetical protein
MAQAAEALTNQPTFDDDAVIAVNLSKIRTAQDNAASHHGSLRNVLKHAEGKGVHLKAAKRALSIVKAGDPDAWLEENQAVTRYLRILRHGLQESQLKLFEFETTLAPIDERAGLDGRAAGLQGDTEARAIRRPATRTPTTPRQGRRGSPHIAKGYPSAN